MTSTASQPRFRTMSKQNMVLTLLGALLVVGPVPLITATNIASFSRGGAPARAVFLFLAANQWLLYTIVGVSMVLGAGIVVYQLYRGVYRFGNWLEVTYPGELQAVDAWTFHENMPVIKPTGIYHSRPVGFLYSELEIVREDLPVASAV